MGKWRSSEPKVIVHDPGSIKLPDELLIEKMHVAADDLNKAADRALDAAAKATKLLVELSKAADRASASFRSRTW